ncbi:MAG: T9SS type A sorting domain-containing protein [Dysgonamonadaceae bacterium]|nr:T9SS type A sorting domain-containing protein [Dysgonamonadaceae bacterium]
MSDGILHVTSTGSEISEITVTGIHGLRVIHSREIGSPTYTTPLHVAPGVYLVTVKLANGRTKVKKVVSD